MAPTPSSISTTLSLSLWACLWIERDYRNRHESRLKKLQTNGFPTLTPNLYFESFWLPTSFSFLFSFFCSHSFFFSFLSFSWMLNFSSLYLQVQQHQHHYYALMVAFLHHLSSHSLCLHYPTISDYFIWTLRSNMSNFLTPETFDITRSRRWINFHFTLKCSKWIFGLSFIFWLCHRCVVLPI